jgi:ATP-dependent RNA helicase DeaD
MTTFKKLALSPETIMAISEMGFEEPIKIQIEAIPLLMQGVDLISQSMTGSGKTAAFVIFLVESVNAKERKPQAIVLTLTRALALQVTKERESIEKYHNLSIVMVYGGASINVQTKKLRRGTDIIVGTPGRVLDMIKKKVLRLESIRIAVLDEADRCLTWVSLTMSRRFKARLPTLGRHYCFQQPCLMKSSILQRHT